MSQSFMSAIIYVLKVVLVPPIIPLVYAYKNNGADHPLSFSVGLNLSIIMLSLILITSRVPPREII